jgi:hypothetical protein
MIENLITLNVKIVVKNTFITTIILNLKIVKKLNAWTMNDIEVKVP